MKILSYLLKKISKGATHLTLLDPNKQSPEKAGEIARMASEGGTCGIMVGGSSDISRENLDKTVKEIKKAVELPVILFPGGISGISKYADAIFFMSLLNSRNPYYITGIQAIGAPIVKKIGIEAIPMGYIVIEPGAKVGKVGEADLIPRDKPEIAKGYALAAQFFGMKLIYLESGSGAPKPVPFSMISSVKNSIDIPLVVGGGIKTKEDARNVVRAGADVIVTGTVVEEAGDAKAKISEIVSSIK